MKKSEAMKIAKSRRHLVDRPPEGYRWGVDRSEGLIVKLPKEKRVPKVCGECGSRKAQLSRVYQGVEINRWGTKVIGYTCNRERACERRRILKGIDAVIRAAIIERDKPRKISQSDLSFERWQGEIYGCDKAASIVRRGRP